MDDQEQRDMVDEVFNDVEPTEQAPVEQLTKPIIKDERIESEEEEFEEQEVEESQEAAEDADQEIVDDEIEEEEEDPDGPTLDDFEALQEQNKQLLAQMNQQGTTMQQSGGFPGIQQQMQQQQAPPVQQQVQQAPPVQQQAPPEQFDLDSALLSPEELDRVIDRPELINVAIQRAVQGAVQHTQQSVGNVSNTVQAQIQQAMWAKGVTDRFFSQNEDLRDPNMRQYVSTVAGNMMHQQQASGQPINFEQTLGAAGQAVRQSLGLKTTVVPAKSKPKPKGGAKLRRKARKPSFAGSSSGRQRKKGAPKRTAQQQSMDEMLDL